MASDLAATDAKIDKMQETLDFLTRSMQTLTQRHAQPTDDASVRGEDESDFAEEASFGDGAAALLPVNRDREHHAARSVIGGVAEVVVLAIMTDVMNNRCLVQGVL